MNNNLTVQEELEQPEEQQNDIMLNYQKSEVKLNADFIYQSLVVEAEKSKLPENIFVNYFLPYFAGDDVENTPSNIVTDWISVAGTPMSEVDIIDNKGEVLYTVPSLFDTSVLNINNKKGERSIPEIYGAYNLKNDHMPIIAENFLSTELDNKLFTLRDQMNSTNVVSKHATKWNEIFNRYNITTNNSNVATGNNTTKNNEDIDDVEY